MNRRIYIAGPMRGIRLYNFPAFDAARDRLAAAGWDVLSPADLDRGTGFEPTDLPPDFDWFTLPAHFSLDDAVTRDIAAIRSCQAVYMLRGWQDSRGARAERAVAEWLGLEVLEEPETILEEALRITGGTRNVDYGGPVEDFTRTAGMWSAAKGVHFEPREVGLFMAMVKISREYHRSKRDNWVDMAGYAHCGHQCAEARNP